MTTYRSRAYAAPHDLQLMIDLLVGVRSAGRNDGYTDPVATHPRFQRMGLARALLVTGLNLLRERGMDTAKLSTSSKNAAMQHTARSVGFEIESTTLLFSKPTEG